MKILHEHFMLILVKFDLSTEKEVGSFKESGREFHVALPLYLNDWVRRWLSSMGVIRVGS